MRLEFECNRLENKTQETKLDKVIKGFTEELQKIGLKVTANTYPRFRSEDD